MAIVFDPNVFQNNVFQVGDVDVENEQPIGRILGARGSVAMVNKAGLPLQVPIAESGAFAGGPISVLPLGATQLSPRTGSNTSRGRVRLFAR